MSNKVALAALLSLMTCGVLVMQATADEPSKSQWDGVYSKEQAHRGETLYSENCLMCHGADLLGGEMAPPLIGGTFQSNWNELTLGDLFERIRVSMPLTAPGSLSRQQYADILSYMLAKDNFPAGKSDLPTQTESLKEIKFLSTKP